jgi:hypothetical protein
MRDYLGEIVWVGHTPCIGTNRESGEQGRRIAIRTMLNPLTDGHFRITKGRIVSDGIDLHLVHGTSRNVCPLMS